jgi:hypothetical protein
MTDPTNRPEPDPTEAIPGDPGMGGLLSDPLASGGKYDAPDPAAGSPDPDSPAPRHHGDWLPTRPLQPSATKRPVPHPLVARRRSRRGMPMALFREGDGTSLDDLRALSQITHRI